MEMSEQVTVKYVTTVLTKKKKLALGDGRLCEPNWPPGCDGITLLGELAFRGRLRIFAKSDCWLRYVCLSFRPHGTSRLPVDGFSRNFTFEYFFSPKICRENSRFIKIWQEYRVLYMNTNIHFWSYLAQFFLELEYFLTEVVEKFKTHILYSSTIFLFENCAVYEIS